MRPESPTFLRSGIEQKNIGEGLFVEVSQLEHLPDTVRKLVPQGFVLKQYVQDPRKEREMLFNASDLTAQEKASMLKRRYDAVKSYFDPILPDFVAPTSFFVGRLGKDGKSSALYNISSNLGAIVDNHLMDRKPRVFEVQERFYTLTDYRKIDESVLRQFSAEKRNQIADKFEIISKAILAFRQEDPAYHDMRVLDVYGTENLALTNAGEWRYIDTNYWFKDDSNVDSVREFTDEMKLDLKKHTEKIRYFVDDME